MPKPKEEPLKPLMDSVKKAIDALKQNQLDTEAQELEQVFTKYNALCFRARAVADSTSDD